MSMPSISFPLDTLIQRLEREGFVIGIDTHLKIQTVLRALGQDFTEDPQSVKYILAPVIAHSQEGQQHFFKVFDEYYIQIVQPAIQQHLSKEKILHQSELPEIDAGVKKHTSMWRWLIPFSAVVILGGIALGLLLVSNLGTTGLELEPVFEIQRGDGSVLQEGDTVYVGEELKFQNRTLEIAERKLQRLGRPDELTAISFSWDFGNGLAEETFNNPRLAFEEEGYFPVTLTVTDSTDSPPTVLPTTQSVRVVCRSKPRLLSFNVEPTKPLVGDSVIISVRTEPEGLKLRWGRNQTPQGSFDNEINTFFTEEGQYTLRILGELGDGASLGSCALLDTSITINIISGDQPVFLDTWQLQQDTSGATEVKFSWLATLLPTLLLMALVFVADYIFGKRRREKLMADQKKNFRLKNGGPFMLSLPDRSHLLSPNHRLFSLAKIMRQRREGEKTQLDIPKTIKETARALGMPQFRYLTTSKASEYLILIDQHHPESHLSKLFHRLAELLKSEDVVLEIFFFDQDHRVCWNDDFPEGITLAQLKQRFARHRLLIYADGHHMIDPFVSQMADWVPESMNIWKTRMVLVTPVTVADWGYRERLLSEFMTIIPADIRCQSLLVERLIAQQNTPFEEQKKALLQEYPETDETLTNYDFNQAEDLRIYLNDSLFEWVSATMVYPVSNWQVSLAIGRALSDRPGAPFLLTYSNLLRISRIPWMQTGLRPAQLRLDLLDSLSPAAEYIGRKTVLALLDGVQVNADSLAAHKLNIQRISNRFFTAPGDEEIAKKMYYLWQDDKLADQAVVNRMSKPAASMNGSTAVDYLSSRFQGINWLKTTARSMLAAVIIGIATFFLHKNYDRSAQLKRWDARWNLHDVGMTQYENVVDSAVHLNSIGVEAYENGQWLKARKAFMHALVYRHRQLFKNNVSSLRWSWEDGQRYSLTVDFSYSKFARPRDINSAREFDREIQNVFSADNSYLRLRPETNRYPLGEAENYPDVGMLAFHMLLNDYPTAGMNLLKVMEFNPGSEVFNQLKYEDAYHDFYLTQLLANKIDQPLQLAGMHGMGLCRFYEGKIKEAQDVQQKIEELAPDYFEENQPPHLRSLLTGYIQDSIQEAVRQDSLLAEAREDSIRQEQDVLDDERIKDIRNKLEELDRQVKQLQEQLAYAIYVRDSLKGRIDRITNQSTLMNRDIRRQQLQINRLRDSVKIYDPTSFERIRQRLEKQPDIYGSGVARLYTRYKKLAYSRKTLPFQKGAPTDPEMKKIEAEIVDIVRKENARLRRLLLNENKKLQEMEYKMKSDSSDSNQELQSMTKSYNDALNRIKLINKRLEEIRKEQQVLSKSLPAAAY